MLLHEAEARQQCGKRPAVLHAPCKFRVAALDRALLEALCDRGVHGFHENLRLGQAGGDHFKDAPDVRLGQVHRQALDDHERGRVRLPDRRAPVVHCGHGKLRDRAALRQKPLPHGDRLRQVEVVPVLIPLHPVAAGIEAAGQIDDDRAGMPPEPRAYKPVEHNGAGDHAAAHGRILLREGKIIVKTSNDLLRRFIADRAASRAFPRAGIDGLQHGFRHAGKGIFFRHESASSVCFLCLSRSHSRPSRYTATHCPSPGCIQSPTC